MAVFRVEKNKNYTVMSNYHLRDTSLSLKAKGLLSLMLSLPDGWDYTTKGLASICRDGIDSICSTVKELEAKGYILRRRARNSKGQLLTTEYIIFEVPQTNVDTAPSEPKPENPVLAAESNISPKRENPILGNPKQGKPEQGNPAQLNTNRSSTKELSTESIYPAAPEDGMDRTKEEIKVKERIDYKSLCATYGKEQVDGIVTLMTDTICSNTFTIRLGRQDIPTPKVRDRLYALTGEHIGYVLDSLQSKAKDIHNPRAYLLTSLYNAPSSMVAAKRVTASAGQIGIQKASYDLEAWEQEALYAPITY